MKTKMRPSSNKKRPRGSSAAPNRVRSLRDELVEIVREDPDAAANILRNWIGSAT